MTIVAVPNYILEQIESRLDEALAKFPEAQSHREEFRQRLLEHVNEHGVIPEFQLAKRTKEGDA